MGTVPSASKCMVLSRFCRSFYTIVGVCYVLFVISANCH